MSQKEVFAKYFIKPQLQEQDGRLDLIRSDDHDLMGFYFSSAWYKKPTQVAEAAYALAYDELLVFVGQDMEHPEDLGGELSLTIAGQEYVTDKSCMVLIPKYVPHGPIRLNKVERPVFSYVGGASKERVPVPAEQWRTPPTVDFADYVLHYNGLDHDEAEFEVFRLHGADNKPVGSLSGVFYGKFRWFKTTTPRDYLFAADSHAHSLPELINFFSTDPDDPVNLGARITLHMMEESYAFEDTTSLFVPANQPHCPMYINQVDRPFMFFTLMPDCQVYTHDK